MESVEFLDDRRVRRRVSFDFTVPRRLGDAPGIDTRLLDVLPLTVMRKVPLRNFDLDSAEGTPVPVLTKAQNELLLFESLAVTGEAVVGSPLNDAVRERLFRVVSEPSGAAEAEVGEWRGLASGADADCAVWKRLTESQAFMDYAEALAVSFGLLVRAEPLPGVRRIIKLGYDEYPIAEARLGRRIGSSLGWRSTSYVFEVSSLSLSASYHFEVAAPPDLEISGARLRLYDPETGTPGTLREDEQPGSRAHLYVAGTEPGADADVVVDFRARREGLLRSSVAVAGLTFLLLLGGYVRLDEIASPEQSQAVTTLLLIVPTLLAAYIVRPGEHRLATTMLFGVRLLVALAALSAVAASAFLASGYAACNWFDWMWLGPVALSGMCTLGLVVTYLRPSASRRT